MLNRCLGFFMRILHILKLFFWEFYIFRNFFRYHIKLRFQRKLGKYFVGFCLISLKNILLSQYQDFYWLNERNKVVFEGNKIISEYATIPEIFNINKQRTFMRIYFPETSSLGNIYSQQCALFIKVKLMGLFLTRIKICRKLLST